MRLSDFHYDLPQSLIAQYPATERSSSRLLVVDGTDGMYQDRLFTDLPELLRPEDILVFNDTRVMAARLYGRKETGGKVEILLERILAPDRALAQVKASKSPVAGSLLYVDTWSLEVIGRKGEFYILENRGGDFQQLMDQCGHMPLPPYIARDDETFDESRYQTVYAAQPGAVAAPTAGLHFDQVLLEQLAGQGVSSTHVTLNVGAGTFQPVRAQDLDQHQMHSEWLQVSAENCAAIEQARRRGGRVVAVGTTSVRSLETAAADGTLRPYTGDTRLFIKPGYRFRVVDAMVTNFHLPESTLLMLVSAFSGYDNIMAAYRHAVAERYRFFSYGDAMFLTRKPGG